MRCNRRNPLMPHVQSAWRIVGAWLVALALAGSAMAQAPAADTAAAPQMSPEELSNLVGRIALYPDDLIAIILPASTNPLQIVQADRFLEKRKSDPKLPIDEKWDEPVKALVNYPDVIKMMSNDLDWTSALGEAVVADQGGVMDAIQAFRRRAEAAGNLKSNDKQTVTVEKEIVTIVQSNPEVIYVPQYNPSTVVVAGAPAYPYYPTPYPVYYYPYAPGAAFATGLIWGAAIGAAWGGGAWGANWGNNDININRNTNINTGNRTNINRGQAGQLPANRGQGGQSWKSDKRPGQVSGATGRGTTTSRVGDAGRAGSGGFGGASGAGGSRPSASTSGFGGGAGGGAGGARAGTTQAGGFGGGSGAGAAQRAGSASASPRDSFGGGSRGGTSGGGFSGYGSGRQTSMDSSRGAASRSSMSGGGRSSMSSGGARGGGGGGARGGGGGRGGGGRR